MTLLRSLASLPLIAGLLLNPVFGASEPKEITWDDLVPAEAQFDDPFTKLDYYQLDDLNMILMFRERIADGITLSEEAVADNREREKRLNDQGIDIDGLLAMRDKVTRERIAKTHLANKELNGKAVRIPGYLLPLEFDGDRVTEFFLVPYVGACIHSPPPPPNQIVYVRTEQGFIPEGGLYAPVWVNGLLKNERGESSLNYVDGSSNIPSSYSLDAMVVEPYE